MSKKKVETEIIEVELRTLVPSETNARRMTKFMYERLVENLENDGELTSTPLVHGTRIISGHHRIRAAMEAGITHAKVMNIVSDISEEHLTALQLSHNSLSGEDDPEILKKMLDELSAEEQAFAAVTIMDPPEMPSFGPSIDVPRPIKLEINFMEPELDSIREVIEKIVESQGGEVYQIERLEHIDEFISVWIHAKQDMDELKNDSHLAMLGRPATLLHMARLAQLAMDKGLRPNDEENF